jgi:hypothetical protein
MLMLIDARSTFACSRYETKPRPAAVNTQPVEAFINDAVLLGGALPLMFHLGCLGRTSYS